VRARAEHAVDGDADARLPQRRLNRLHVVATHIGLREAQKRRLGLDDRRLHHRHACRIELRDGEGDPAGADLAVEDAVEHVAAATAQRPVLLPALRAVAAVVLDHRLLHHHRLGEGSRLARCVGGIVVLQDPALRHRLNQLRRQRLIEEAGGGCVCPGQTAHEGSRKYGGSEV